MSTESIVVTGVIDHFSAPKYDTLSVKTEYPIQMGSDNRRADVVLINRDGDLVAIIECKKLGYQGEGIDQLQSYLSATNTPLGVFANSRESNSWIFIRNLGQNQFRDIAPGEFEKRVFKRPIMKRFFSRNVRARKEDHTVQDKNGDGSIPDKNGGDSDSITGLNGSPYYSEENGYYWAKNHRGLPECVPPHIKLIISTTKEEEINLLGDEKSALEEQKHDCDQKIEQKNQNLLEKKQGLAGLEIQLKAPKETELSPPPDPHYDAIKQLHREEINQLREEKDATEEEIEQKSQEFDQKEEALARLEVELESPTEAELKLGWLRESSLAQILFAFFSTVALVGILFYLFVFYASAGDKAFSSTRGSSVEQQLNEIVNHAALHQAWQEGNYFVLLFPFIFLVLAIVTHHFFTLRKWGSLIVVLIITFLLDLIIAFKIARNIWEDKEARGLLPEGAEWSVIDINILAVLFLGFAVSILLSCGLHSTLERWKSVKMIRRQSNIPDQIIRDGEIKTEKIQRETQVASLKKEIENLQDNIIQLKEKNAAIQPKIEEYQDKITALSWQQIEAQILVLKIEIDNLQKEIEELNSTNKMNEKSIEEARKKIEEELRQRHNRLVDRKKIEVQVNQFLNGWFQYVVQHGTMTAKDVSPRINKIREVADETVDQYYQEQNQSENLPAPIEVWDDENKIDEAKPDDRREDRGADSGDEVVDREHAPSAP